MLDPEIENINKWLLKMMGKVAKREGELNDATQPQKYRLVWGPDEICKRITFNADGTEGPVEERRKYEYMAPNHYVLEVWCATPDHYTAGGENGTYEAMHIFHEMDGSYQRPNQQAVEFYMECLRRGMEADKKTQNDVDRDSRARYQEDADKILEIMNQNIPYETHMVRTGQAVYNAQDKKGN